MVAEQIVDKFPCNSILRRHCEPKESIKDLGKVLNEMGYELDFSCSLNLNKSLDKIKKESDPFFNQLIRIITTRYMNEA